MRWCYLSCFVCISKTNKQNKKKSLRSALNTVCNRAVLLLLRPPFPEPHLRRGSRGMEAIDVVHGVWVRLLAGADAHVAALVAVRPGVLAQRRGFLEGAVAEGAAAGPLPGVDELVVLEVLQATQALPADGAHVGLLARVRAPVLAQTVQVAEAVAAFGARVGLLAGVNAQVRFERPGLSEAAATHRARVRLLARVDADVLLQAGDQTEGLAALQAVMRPVRRGLPRGVGGRWPRRLLGSAW